MERTLKPNILVTGKSIYCWISEGSKVIAECKAVDAGDVLLVDEIFVSKGYRNLGMGSSLVKTLQKIKEVIPCGVEDTPEAVSFWNKLGLEDGINHPEYDRYYTLLIENSLFENLVEEAS